MNVLYGIIYLVLPVWALRY